MIFVGDGALLKNSIEYSIANQHPIEYVFCTNNEIADFLNKERIAYKITSDINQEYELVRRKIKDGIILSINNGQLFKTPILSLHEIRVYNIHNGILPQYRGLPEICILFAILNGDTEYGVSLHKVDAGIDTGPCYDIMKFSIGNEDTFQQVMFTGINFCSTIYQMNIDRIISGKLMEMPLTGFHSKLYTYDDLDSLHNLIDNVNFNRAIKLGIFRIWFKELSMIINRCKKK